jgi:hypothetical protein
MGTKINFDEVNGVNQQIQHGKAVLICRLFHECQTLHYLENFTVCRIVDKAACLK